MVALAHRVTACLTLALALWLSIVFSILSAQAQDVITVGHCFRDSKCKDKFPAAIQSKPDGYEPIWATCISFMSDHNHGNLCKYLNCSSCVPLVTNFCYAGGPWDAYCAGDIHGVQQ